MQWTQSVNRDQARFLNYMIVTEKVALSEADYIRLLIDKEMKYRQQNAEMRGLI